MHLAETSLIKKYENDIGNNISGVGGEVPYDLHWLPFLDNVIQDQLVGGFIIDKKIDEKLDERGLTPEAIASWNQAVIDLGFITDRVTVLENRPANSIEQSDINDWNESSHWQENNI